MTPTIRILTAHDLHLLAHVAPDVFDNPVSPAWAAEFLADPRHHLAVAIIDNLVIGMASAVHYIHPDKPPELWINEVGVAPPHQNRGLGRQLLQALFTHALTLGCTTAWVATEPNNTPANRLYQSTNGTPTNIIMYTFNLNKPH